MSRYDTVNGKVVYLDDSVIDVKILFSQERSSFGEFVVVPTDDLEFWIEAFDTKEKCESFVAAMPNLKLQEGK